MNKEFDNIPFFSYLRVYTVNSSITLLFYCSFFTAGALRLATWVTSEPSQYFIVHITLPIVNTGYYFGTMIDLVLTLNRIAIFRKPVKKLFVLRPYKLCAVIFAICVITDFPYFVFYTAQPLSFSVFSASNIVEIWTTGISDFRYSQAGIIITILLECWRDVFLALVVIAVNIWLVHCFKVYLKQRAELIHGGLPLALPVVSSSTTKNQVKKVKKQAARTMGQQDEVSSADLRSTIMAIVVSMLTVCDHISLIACTAYPYIDSSLLMSNYVCYGAVLGTAVKHAANFFVFYFFNKKFAEKLHKMFRC
jgi:hypothetical protein